jgi:hypothetical protein
MMALMLLEVLLCSTCWCSLELAVHDLNCEVLQVSLQIVLV